MTASDTTFHPLTYPPQYNQWTVAEILYSRHIFKDQYRFAKFNRSAISCLFQKLYENHMLIGEKEMKFKISTITLLFCIIVSNSTVSKENDKINRFSFGFNLGYSTYNLSGINRFIDTWGRSNYASMDNINNGVQYSLLGEYKLYKSPFLLLRGEYSYFPRTTSANSTYLFFDDSVDIYIDLKLASTTTFLDVGYGYNLVAQNIDLYIIGGIGYYYSDISQRIISKDEELPMSRKGGNQASNIGYRFGFGMKYRITDTLFISSHFYSNILKINTVRDEKGETVWVIDTKDVRRKLEIDQSGLQLQIGLGLSI
jgi:opacity protein-like surface antigen